MIGFDNIEESQYLQIPLTTMDSRLEWTAPTAVERILGASAVRSLSPSC